MRGVQSRLASVRFLQKRAPHHFNLRLVAEPEFICRDALMKEHSQSIRRLVIPFSRIADELCFQASVYHVEDACAWLEL